MTIEVKIQPNQDVNITTLNTQEVIITNDTDEQNIVIEDNCSQEIDIDAVSSQEIEVEQDGITINVNEAPDYEGEYKVTPKVAEQILSTARKILNEDVVVEKIPYFEVSNNSGGITASIGDE